MTDWLEVDNRTRKIQENQHLEYLDSMGTFLADKRTDCQKSHDYFKNAFGTLEKLARISVHDNRLILCEHYNFSFCLCCGERVDYEWVTRGYRFGKVCKLDYCKEFIKYLKSEFGWRNYNAISALTLLLDKKANKEVEKHLKKFDVIWEDGLKWEVWRNNSYLKKEEQKRIQEEIDNTPKIKIDLKEFRKQEKLKRKQAKEAEGIPEPTPDTETS